MGALERKASAQALFVFLCLLRCVRRRLFGHVCRHFNGVAVTPEHRTPEVGVAGRLILL